MTRGMAEALETAISGAFNPAVLVLIDWPGGAVRVHSGIGTLDWDDEEWLGVGMLPGAVRLPAEEAGMASTEGSLRLGGLPADINAILAADARGAAVDVWFGATTARAGVTLVSDPVLIWSGYVDGRKSREAASSEGRTSEVTLAIRSRGSQRLSSGAYHTDADQQAEFPGDTAGRWLLAALTRTQAETVKF